MAEPLDYNMQSGPRSSNIDHAQWLCAVIGLVGIGLCCIGWISGNASANAFYRAWLYAWFYWFGMSMGCMAWVMIHHLVGGGWGRAIQRIAEAGSMNVWMMAILFIPVIIGIKHLYPWADGTMVAADAILMHKAPYMHLSFWIGRSIFYFVAWWIFCWSLVALQRRYDSTLSARTALLARRISAGGLVFYVFVMTLAGVDWIMSREAHWYSNVYGFILVVGQALMAINLLVIVLTCLLRFEPLKSFVTRGHYNDLGNLMLTTVILWAYMNLAQFLITWMGGIQVDVTYYSQRWHLMYGIFTILLHFFLPFFVLLMKDFKRSPDQLWKLSLFLLIVHLFDVYWMVWPSGPPIAPSINRFWLNIAAPVGIGGLWLALMLWRIKRAPLLAALAHAQPYPSLESMEDPEVGPHGEHHAHPA